MALRCGSVLLVAGLLAACNTARPESDGTGETTETGPGTTTTAGGTEETDTSGGMEETDTSGEPELEPDALLEQMDACGVPVPCDDYSFYTFPHEMNFDDIEAAWCHVDTYANPTPREARRERRDGVGRLERARPPRRPVRPGADPVRAEGCNASTLRGRPRCRRHVPGGIGGHHPLERLPASHGRRDLRRLHGC